VNIGLLWQDTADDPLPVRLARAAEHYEYKHGGLKPTICFVNRELLPEDTTIDGIAIRGKKDVQLTHLWLGVEDG